MQRNKFGTLAFASPISNSVRNKRRIEAFKNNVKSHEEIADIVIPAVPFSLKREQTLSTTTNIESNTNLNKEFASVDNLDSDESRAKEFAFIQNTIPGFNKVKFITPAQDLMRKQLKQNVDSINQAIENYIKSVDEFIQNNLNYEAIEVIK